MPKASNTQWSDNRSQAYPLKFILFLKTIGRTILRNCHLLTTIVRPHKLSWAYEGLIIFTGEYVSKSSVSKFSCTTITMGCEDKVTLRASGLIIYAPQSIRKLLNSQYETFSKIISSKIELIIPYYFLLIVYYCERDSLGKVSSTQCLQNGLRDDRLWTFKETFMLYLLLCQGRD